MIILKYLPAGEEFLKFNGKSVLLLVFIFIQQIPDDYYNNYKICIELYNLINILMKTISTFIKEEIYEFYLKDFDVIFCYFAKFLDKVKTNFLKYFIINIFYQIFFKFL